jgi:hypothetical protein
VEDPNKQKKTYQLILSNAYRPSFSSTSTSITKNAQTEAIVNNSEVETMPIFDQEVLTKLSHATLKDLCRKHNIKPGKQKADKILVQHINIIALSSISSISVIEDGI